MDRTKTVLITGAAGNLGSRLARHLLPSGHTLRLMVHHRPLPDDLVRAPNVTAVRADLGAPETLVGALDGVEVIVHFAGVLFAPRPERFLSTTNVQWFDNLLTAALESRVGRVVLMSFPHVEGPTSPTEPAIGRLDRQPPSVHAQTRLEAERLLMNRTQDTDTAPVILRLGMVYGRGILMVEAARWLAERQLLGVWREPTWMQLISTIDFLRATEAAIERPNVHGIYHVGDEEPVTLQHLLDEACRVWGCSRPFRAPLWMIYTVAGLCELTSAVVRTRSPLTRDFVRIGRVSHWGDTRRAREELLPTLEHPTLASGMATF